MTRNHLSSRPIVHRARPAPAVLLSHAPLGVVELRSYGDAMAYLTERTDAAGIIVVSAHWLEPGESPNLLARVVQAPGEIASVAATELANRVEELLSRAGLTCDVTGARMPEANCQRTVALLAAESTRPLVHLSVPVNFGADLMILTGAALMPLRSSGVLLAGCGAALDEEVLANATETARLKGLARRAPRQQLVHIYPWLTVVAATSAAERAGEIQKLPGARIAVFGLHHDAFDMLPARAVMTTEGAQV